MQWNALEQHNLEQLEGLNQRGGRMLSLVDLVEANTVSLELAADLAARVAAGTSLLTAAVPGGSGKTTVMAALLSFLPPGVRLVTVSSPEVLHRGYDAPVCFLPHEIGSGPWFGYLWGRDVARLFALTRRGHAFASCLHADTLPELKRILCGRELAVAPEDFARVGLLAFLRIGRRGLGVVRRVSHVYVASPAGDPTLRWEWREANDGFAYRGGGSEDPPDAPLTPGEAKALLTDLQRRNRRTLSEVRAAVLSSVGS